MLLLRTKDLLAMLAVFPTPETLSLAQEVPRFGEGGDS